VKILRELKPKYFLLENVASMTNKNKDIMSEIMGVEPILINSNTLSAQDRARYYWTNILAVEQPKAKHILLRDIMQQDVEEKYYYNKPFEFHGWDKKIIATLEMKGHEQMKRVYNPLSTCGTLTACRGGNLQKKVFSNGRCRKLTPTEYELLQTVPIGYTEGVAETQRYNMLGDGWTIDVIAHIFKNIGGV
jgi:site-specific DNA-cytosine methylase